MPIDLHVFRTCHDNAGTLIRDRASGLCAAIDAPDTQQVHQAANAQGWTISRLFITHEHADHVQGARALKQLTGCMVTGPAAAGAGADLDEIVAEGSCVKLGETEFEIWETPGHCAGHVAWVSTGASVALVGDVLFVMGCGRLSGDTAPQLWRALSRLGTLPDDFMLVTGHDYTASNGRFARFVEPGNARIAARATEAERRAAAGAFWAVTTMGEEKATNPFLRAADPAMQARIGAGDAGATFAALRAMKNSFRG